MLALAAAAAIAASPTPSPGRIAAPTVQATATVRILAGARVKLSDAASGDGFRARAAVLNSVQSTQKATLIEFE